MGRQNALTLVFEDPDLERAYASHAFARTLEQGRVAIAVGVFLYLLYAVLDIWSVPPEHLGQVWAIRLAALCVPLTVYATTSMPWFRHVNQVLLAAVGLAGGIGMLGMFVFVPVDKLPLFFPGIVLVAFYTYNLVGTRFAYALAVDLFLIGAFNVVFWAWKGYPTALIVSQDFVMVSATLIGGAAGYLNEYQRRQLYLRERELDRQRLEHLDRALHDPLTGLANTELLHDRLTQALAQSRRDGTVHAAFFVDLDGFKRINDVRGHAAGDQALKQVAARLSLATRSADTVARLGGDEFFVVSLGLSNADDAVGQADRMLALVESIEASTPDCPLGASIGICLFPFKDATASDVIRRADRAMYQAKKSGKGRCHLAQEERERITTRMAIGRL